MAHTGLGTHPTIPVRRLPIQLHNDDRRVIMRPFPLSPDRLKRVFASIQALSDEQISTQLDWVEKTYAHRHRATSSSWLENYSNAAKTLASSPEWSAERKLLAGAYLTLEYSVESAALFNPSICIHPDQSGAVEGGVRFILSLRATGEGHVSSIVFRTGVVNPDDTVTLDTLPDRLHRAQMHPDRLYILSMFRRKLSEMGLSSEMSAPALEKLPERFTLDQLRAAVQHIRSDNPQRIEAMRKTVLWLAESNYHIEVSPDARLDELAIFPMSPEESHGMEDLRLTRFVDEDGSTTYHGTYTAYNGVRTLPMLLTTTDFKRIEFHSLNGRSAVNKGMALFPRKIGGHYVMCSRIDGESLFISTSDSVHFWESADLLIRPEHPWELMQIGNCGAPVETPRGWLLLTHGVGPMRTYSIGAMVLDLDDPRKVLGHLREPLLAPTEAEREGYVPNVVYTCGSLLFQDDLFIPFALADTSTSLAVVNVNALIDQAIEDRGK